MKYEMKIEINQEKELKELIEKCYFDDNNGKLRNKDNSLKISKDDPIFIMLKGLNNMTVRITNEKLIEGSSRFVVDENENEVNLLPCNIYCIIENSKYSFY